MIKTLILTIILIFYSLTCQAAPTLLFFTASWCGSCKKMQKNWENPEVQTLLNDYKFFEVDVDQKSKYSKSYGVSAVPTTVFVNTQMGPKRETFEVKRHAGYLSVENLKKFLKK